MKIAICDDLPAQSALIHTVTRDCFFRHNEQEVMSFVYNNSLLFLESLQCNGGFDILRLDICMPGINGTEIGSEVRTSLAQFLDELSEGQFDTPCKGYMVNRRAIHMMEVKRVILQNGQSLPIVRGSFREFQAQHFAYMFPDGDCL